MELESPVSIVAEQLQQHQIHYIFGYGSLICPQSRAISAPTLAHRRAIPVRVQRLVRTWNCRCETPRATFLGVQQVLASEEGRQEEKKQEKQESGAGFRDSNKSCVGVLIQVLANEMSALDERESNYDRHLVGLDRIERVDELLVPSNENHYRNTFLDGASVSGVATTATVVNSNATSNSPVCVWVYIPQQSNPATVHYPIVQSYVDICMRGCLSISSMFLQEFLSSTYGWHYDNLLGMGERTPPAKAASLSHSRDVTAVTSSDEVAAGRAWSNDRHDPIYKRADQMYSLENANHLDTCLIEALLPVNVARD
jgi:hypothetical protein